MVLVKGDKRSPEPTLTVIKFPGGQVEVSRCSDGVSYWAHLHINESAEILDSRVEYNHEIYSKRHDEGLKPIPKIEEQQHIRKMAVRLNGQYESTEYL